MRRKGDHAEGDAIASARIRLDREYVEHYAAHRDTIRERLAEFVSVAPSEYLFELMFCLLTPQSRAAHAEQVIARLREGGFPERAIDPVPILRDPRHYIRFHNQKAKRLLAVRERETEIRTVIESRERTSASKREWLVANVSGLGWKEASHFLRNIGHLDLAIIDRHILKHMLRNGAIDEMPASIGTRKTYLALEEQFRQLAVSSGLALQELDLLFWSFEEGSVRK